MSTNILFEQFTPIISDISTISVVEGTYRLDSQYYSLFENKIASLSAESFISLSECCKEIYEVPPFKHIYVEKGIPFYTSSDLFDNEFTPTHYLTPDMPNIQSYIIRKGQILMARSGNVESGILGQITIVGDVLNNTTTSDHVIRFTADNEIIPTGYLACFLMSDFCKGQLLKNAAGAVIPAIRPASLYNLQIPLTDSHIQDMIADMILEAVEKREAAVKLIHKARSLVIQYNTLPSLSECIIESLDPDNQVQIRNTRLTEFNDDYRLDSHFYNPTADLVVKNIERFSAANKNLNKIADCSFRGSRSTRYYVNADHGTPFLSGKNIIQIRPPVKYISNTETANISEMIIEKNWILISRSGTLGRTTLIWNNYEDYAASEHLIRVVPFENEIDPGYLYAFLSSDYGYHQLLRFKHGSVIDEITEDQISKTIVPIIDEIRQKEIGDLIRVSYNLRADAISLEDKAQEILSTALTNV